MPSACPKDYIRRQTVKSAERFITPELKSFEDKVLGARERCAGARARALRGRAHAAHRAPGPAAADRRRAGGARLPSPASPSAPAQLDWTQPELVSRAAAARSKAAGIRWWSGSRRRRSCPTISRSMLGDACSSSPARTWAVSPPTCARRALIAILAHIGSFVPAERASHRPAGSHLHAHRRGRRSRRRALHVHGGDDRGGQHPAQRHRHAA